ncbi:unnamed protein product, partial [Amoebophrya sp. A25]
VENQRNLFSASASAAIYSVQEYRREKLRASILSLDRRVADPAELLQQKQRDEAALGKQKHRLPVSFFRRKNAVFDLVARNAWADTGSFLLVLDQKKIGHNAPPPSTTNTGVNSTFSSPPGTPSASSPTSSAEQPSAPAEHRQQQSSLHSSISTLFLFELTLVLNRLSFHLHPHMLWTYSDILEYFAPAGYTPPPMTEECLDR